MPSNPAKRALEAPSNPFKRAKRTIKPTLKAREGDGTLQSHRTEPIEPLTPPPTQPIELPNDYIETLNARYEPPINDELPRRSSPREILRLAAAQATQEEPFERQLMDLTSEGARILPNNASQAATEATVDNYIEDVDPRLPPGFVDDLEGINFTRLPGYCKPGATTKRGRSWVFQHGYRIAKLSNMKECWWLCKYCH